jgi:putative hydrolase of the HAD superfamily
MSCAVVFRSTPRRSKGCQPSSRIWPGRPASFDPGGDLLTRAVIFDFYGTLAHWRDRGASNYTAVFAAHGYQLGDDVLNAYFARYDGVAHAAHSVSQAAYEDWVRLRLCDLTDACAVEPGDRDSVIDALRAVDHDPMVAYPEAGPTLAALRGEGWAIGVCSNWGWELDPFLRELDLLDLVDVAVTSARAGARKPHPSIYDLCVGALGADVSGTVFVGDSWAPDVVGPHQAGMTAVHVWRAGEHPGPPPYELAAGMHRIGDLSELLPLLGVTFR